MRTRIQNVTSKAAFFGFLPLHGKLLVPNQNVILDGDLRTDLAGGMNRFARPSELAALQKALDNLEIEYETFTDSFIPGEARFDLWNYGDGTRLDPDIAGLLPWLKKGDLPPGSILKSVSVDATIIQEIPAGADTWASDLSVYFDADPSAPGTNGILQIGQDDDIGTVAKHIFWANGDFNPIARVYDTKYAGVDFLDGLDLHDLQVSLVSSWESGVWTGAVWLTYEYPPMPSSSSSSSSTP